MKKLGVNILHGLIIPLSGVNRIHSLFLNSKQTKLCGFKSSEAELLKTCFLASHLLVCEREEEQDGRQVKYVKLKQDNEVREKSKKDKDQRGSRERR